MIIILTRLLYNVHNIILYNNYWVTVIQFYRWTYITRLDWGLPSEVLVYFLHNIITICIMCVCNVCMSTSNLNFVNHRHVNRTDRNYCAYENIILLVWFRLITKFDMQNIIDLYNSKPTRIFVKKYIVNKRKYLVYF